MTKIQPVRSNYQESNFSRNRNNNRNYETSFGASDAYDLLPISVRRALKRASKPEAGPIRKFFENKIFVPLNDTKGEIQNQLINAAFTCTLAPYFISHNPVAKTDQKTKSYTAWRQPISALIAIFGGIGLTMPIDRFWNKHASEGDFKAIDLRVQPTTKYLEKIFNNEMKKDPKFYMQFDPGEDLDEEIAKHKLKSNGKPTYAFKKACRDNYVEQEQKKARDFYADVISTNPDDIKFKKADKIVEVTYKVNENGKEVSKTVSRQIPNVTSESEFNAFINEHNLYRMKFGEFMSKHAGFEFYRGTDYKLKPYAMKRQLDAIFAMDWVTDIGLIPVNTYNEKDLSRIINELRQTDYKILSEIYTSYHDGILTPCGDKQLATATGKQSSRIAELNSYFNKFDKKDLRLCQISNRLGFSDVKLPNFDRGMSDTIIATANENMQEVLRTPMNKVLEGFVPKLNRVTGIEIKDGLRYFAKNMAKAKSVKLSKKFEVFKTWANIIVNLPMAAITCTALNWIYPRFMEKFKPDLLKKDDNTKKGGNK